MPNTKSAERRTRSNARKQVVNHTRKANLKTIERTYLSLVKEGKKPEAATSLREVASLLDKAAKTGVMHKGTTDRKKSRLTLMLNTLK